MNKGRPQGTGGIYKKREDYNKQVSHSDRQMKYITNQVRNIEKF